MYPADAATRLWFSLCDNVAGADSSVSTLTGLLQGPTATGTVQSLEKLLNERNTLLHIAAIGAGPEAVRALLDAGANPTIKNDNGQTPFDVTSNVEVKKILETAMQARTWVQSLGSERTRRPEGGRVGP